MLELLTKKVVPALGIILCCAYLAQAQDGVETSNALLAKLANPDHRLQSVAFSPDGKLLAAGYGFYDDGGITIWRVADRSVIATLLGRSARKAGINSVAFSADGKLFAAASDRGDVFLWTVGSWRLHKTVLTRRGDTSDLSFSPDSTKLAYSSDSAAILYDIPSGKVTVMATGDRFGNSFNGISFSPDSKFVIVCGDKKIQVWDVERQQMAKVFVTTTFGFFGRLSPDGLHLIEGGGSIYGPKSVQIWNFSDGRKINNLTDFRSGLFALAISHSGKLFAVAGGDYGGEGSVSLWNLEDVRELGFASFGDSPLHGVAFSPDDTILAVASDDGYVLLYAVDRLRGPQAKKRDTALCGEIMVEGQRAFIVPISKVPNPMRTEFEFPWRLEVANADSVMAVAGSPVVLQDWYIESNAATDRARIKKVSSLLSQGSSLGSKSDYVVFGTVQNPGWNEGYVAKIYGDGSFLATNNSGKCLSYGTLAQLNTDLNSVKQRLVGEGLLEIPQNPLTIGADHYRTRFIELTNNGMPELRSDAESFELLMKGGPAKKREAFSRIFNQEESFINSLLHAGMKLPLN